ncbi:major facilitator superfamily domain-containing protein [Trichoderma camerunense]
MFDTLRDSLFCQAVRLMCQNRILCYPEETVGFDPEEWLQPTSPNDGNSPPSRVITMSQVTIEIGSTSCDTNRLPGSFRQNSTVNAGYYLVGWYGDDDPENPRNWSLTKKLALSVYAFCVYLGSSIYTASTAGVMKEFGVNYVQATLGLAMYILGYGIGPLLWSPLSEIPAVGRTPPYVLTFAVFVGLCVAAAMTKSFGGLCISRFLMGFFDFAPIKMPYLLALWGGSATLGPAIGPVVVGFSVPREGWRWSQWELLWFAGPLLVCLFIFLPETNPENILMHRAQRLRRITGRTNIKSESEIKQSHMSPREIVYYALIKPWEINALDPSVLFTTIYISLVYATFYSFFESFPLVYPVIYGFNEGQTGLAFMSVIVGLVISIPAYCIYYYFWVEPKVLKDGWGKPEDRLKPAILGSYMIPVGVFIFAWTTRHNVHWMPSIVGVGINNAGQFFILQPVFMYLTMTYPQFAASLMAANDFARSALAAGAVLVSRPMFTHLGVPGGVSLLGGLNFICIGGVCIMYYLGPKLRARSRFAAT